MVQSAKFGALKSELWVLIVITGLGWCRRHGRHHARHRVDLDPKGRYPERVQDIGCSDLKAHMLPDRQHELRGHDALLRIREDPGITDTLRLDEQIYRLSCVVANVEQTRNSRKDHNEQRKARR